MLSGEQVYVNTQKFQNDMRIVCSKSDVLTVLIHLGYLAYNEDSKKCYIPNKEVGDEFLNAVEDTSWTRLVDSIIASQELLDATISGNEQAVAQAIAQVLTMDVGFGDVVTPHPVALDYPLLLEGLPEASILAYSTETVICSRFQKVWLTRQH